jgi:hypothetical protein
MPIQQIPDTSLRYFLMCFDKNGRERTDDPDGPRLSERLLSDIAKQSPTDIFLLSHGWKGDVPAAQEQYNNWIKAMTNCQHDIAEVRSIRTDFRPLIIGFHWPSLPFGDEEFGSGIAAFDSTPPPGIEELVSLYADRIADSPAARAALKSIFSSALMDNEPSTLPDDVVRAYAILNQESQLRDEGEGAAPGADREPFDAETAYQNARSSMGDEFVNFGGFSLSGLLAPLQQMSFWKMKDRARLFGESGGHDVIRRVQNAVPEAKIHLMGHSFGCIVVSASVAGPPGGTPLPRPVNTLFLVQGALSLWSYCSSISPAGGRPGYFRSIFANRGVSGVIVATTSEYDKAVGRFYPLGAGVARQVSFAPGELPKYGGLGSFGIQGPDTDATSVDMLAVDQKYAFRPKCAYNVNADSYICNGQGVAGAHSDIAHPEVAHAYWDAILAGA